MLPLVRRVEISTRPEAEAAVRVEISTHAGMPPIAKRAITHEDVNS
jgi:hypothetical protein